MIDDLSSYELAHLIPFTRDVFERLFTLHNEDLWPAHLVAFLLGVIVVWRARRGDGGAVGLILAIAWAFVGWTFFLGRYAELLWAASWMGGAFLVQAVALFWHSRAGRLEFDMRSSSTILAVAVIVLWPFLAPLSGRAWTGVEIFGIAPDPTVALSLALMTASRRAHPVLWIIPLMWALISGATMWAMQIQVGLIMPVFCIALALLTTAARLRSFPRPQP